MENMKRLWGKINFISFSHLVEKPISMSARFKLRNIEIYERMILVLLLSSCEIRNKTKIQTKVKLRICDSITYITRVI